MAETDAARPERAAPEEVFTRLRLFNAVMGCLHLVQGVAMLILSNDSTLPLRQTFLNEYAFHHGQVAPRADQSSLEILPQLPRVCSQPGSHVVVEDERDVVFDFRPAIRKRPPPRGGFPG